MWPIKRSFNTSLFIQNILNIIRILSLFFLFKFFFIFVAKKRFKNKVLIFFELFFKNSIYIPMRYWFAQQVFSKAAIWFSTDGETYEDEPLLYSYIPDLVLENARNVSIGLHERQGSLLKLHLYFAARWIIISEVTFDASELLLSL